MYVKLPAGLRGLGEAHWAIYIYIYIYIYICIYIYGRRAISTGTFDEDRGPKRTK